MFRVSKILIWVLFLSACTLGQKPEAGTSCVSGDTYLNAMPVPVATDYVGVLPMGYLNPEAGEVFPVGKLYFWPWSDDPMANPPTFSPFNVVSPGDDLKLRAIVTRRYDGNGVTEYSLFMKPCAEVRVYMEHVSTLGEDLIERLNESNPEWENSEECIDGSDGWGNYTDCISRFSRLTLSSDELIGTAGKYNPMTFGVYDRNVDVPYLTPLYYTLSLDIISETIGFTIENHLQWELITPTFPAYGNAACPLDYFPGEGSEFPTVHFTDPDGNVIGDWDGSNCGRFVEDNKNRGSGNWFRQEALDEVLEEDGVALYGADRFSIALVHDSIQQNGSGDVDYPVFSIGEVIEINGGGMVTLDAGRYDFTVAPAGTTNRDFDSLVVGTEYCYETLNRLDGATAFAGVFRLKMTNSKTLLFEAFGAGGDNCGNTAIDGQAITFVR